ncbi:hypothetical protein P153DRAFT_300930 [Dothidotthia symphoricarpi CBS 119687]|uniref:Uncharacterized protein n=1 Tax=Dothidotthia symphoricarpi CBS 119687 TaxID=1392245 RepID=A0A6A6A105_9PLEO|nr:uncharacterized protein P153DRAFT_300930 [Dothidotthia symphoricarpi CBS 119687]KAF2125196.1 hypothetical protein P153DRAFT_300930 [Dothidotthia symphoricarpi CBS 119687]
MCRVDERVYIDADGHRQKFEDAYPCDKAPRGKLCSRVKRRTSEYHPKRPTVSRGDTPSPASNNPPTPTDSGTYLVQTRRPSNSGSRPSTREGLKAVKPEIVISFGSKKEDGKPRPTLAVSSKSYKRSSRDVSSEFTVDSPGSDGAHTIRTGFPEKAPPSTGATFGRSDGFVPTSGFLQGLHHHHAPSLSSYTSSSQPPSLYVTSDPDYDSPTGYRHEKHPPTTVHNPPSINPPPSPTVTRTRNPIPTTAYRTTVIEPQGFSKETHTADGLYPLDFSDVVDRSAFSPSSPGAHTQLRESSDREQKRKEKEEARRRKEALERQLAEQLLKEDNNKQVRFELGRAEARARERAENIYAEQEKTRAEEREKARRQKEKEREEQDRKERKREKEREEHEKRERKRLKEVEEQEKKERRRAKEREEREEQEKKERKSRRMSMTQAQSDEQRRLLAAEGIYMQGEREAAEARERQEASLALQQQHQTADYYVSRGGDRNSTDNPPPKVRRNSTARQGGVSTIASQPTPARVSGNRRASIVQPELPAINTQMSQGYSTRGLPSARQHAPPPVSYPAGFHQDQARPPSARRPSYSQENQNPFAAHPNRGSGSSLEDPFAHPPSAFSPPMFSPSLLSPTVMNRDPWDIRGMGESLPVTRPALDSRNSLQRRGEDVINRAGASNRPHLGRSGGYEDTYALASDSEDDDQMISYRRTRRV